MLAACEMVRQYLPT